MRYKKVLRLVAIAVILVFTGVTIFPINPLRRSESDLRAWILKQVPLGSSVGQVKAFIQSKGWKLVSEWSGNPSSVSSETAYPSVKDYPGIKGDYFIQVDLGSYQGIPFRVNV